MYTKQISKFLGPNRWCDFGLYEKRFCRIKFPKVLDLKRSSIYYVFNTNAVYFPTEISLIWNEGLALRYENSWDHLLESGLEFVYMSQLHMELCGIYLCE